MLIGLPAIKRLWDRKKQQKRALILATILAVTYETWMVKKLEDERKEEDQSKKDQQPSRTTSSNNPIISAARNGITETVEVILKRNPLAIEHRNKKNENIHIAARYRRIEILDLLQHLPVSISRFKILINADGDTILHQAAYLDEHKLRDRPGEALRLQSEIQWFKVLILLAFPLFLLENTEYLYFIVCKLYIGDL